jgi:membrane protein required for colicin V production
MTWFDFLVIAVLALSIGFAVIRGALREIGTLVVLAAAALFAILLIRPLQGALGADSFTTTIVIAGALGLAGFIGLYFLFHLALSRFALSARATRADRIAGAGFGLLRGLALVGLGFLAYAYYLDEERRPDAVRRAVTLPIASAMAGFFEGFAPAGAKLDSEGEAKPAEPATNAAVEGYGRGERAALAEIVTTVTTTEGAEPTAQNDEPAGDPIADILKGNTPE